MSALPKRADIALRELEVPFVPRGDMASHLQMKEAASVGCLFSHTGAYLGPSLHADGGIHRERGHARDRVDRPGVEPPL
jgi:hypothetical protein